MWPNRLDVSEQAADPKHLTKIQEFRLSEVVWLSNAEEAALFRLRTDRCSVLLSNNIADDRLDRLTLYLEDGRQHGSGFWFERAAGGSVYYLYVAAPIIPAYVKTLITHYLAYWANLFSSDFAGNVDTSAG